MSTIILTGGGTAGHCTPHLAILPELKKKFDNIYYIGSFNGVEKEIISQVGIPYYSISTAKFRRNLSLKNLAIPYSVLKGVHEAKQIIKELKPNVIFSKGGFVSVPTVIAGAKLKIPIVAHESDLTVGLANKISARYCDKVLTTFEETASSLKNGLFLGAPVRKSLFINRSEETLNSFGFKNKLPVLLVTGGSLGAKAINDTLREALPIILSKYNVIHLCGKGNLIESNFSGYYQAEYMHDVGRAFSIADVCVSRAGSNTIFELLALKKNCLLIPLPKTASRGDQILNANYFYNRGLVNVLDQEKLSKDTLIEEIDKTYKNRFNFQKKLSENPFLDKSPDIAQILFDYV